MSANQQTWWLFGGVFALLIFASAVGWLLQLRYVARGHPDHPGIANLNARIKAWWVIVGLIGFAFLFGRTGVIVLFGLVSFFALREFITLTPTRRGDHVALAVAFFLVLPEQYVLVAMGWYGMFSIFIPVYVFLLLPIIAALFSDTAHFLERGAKI
jgi:phosphatidate cytidylyltransferase